MADINYSIVILHSKRSPVHLGSPKVEEVLEQDGTYLVVPVGIHELPQDDFHVGIYCF